MIKKITVENDGEIQKEDLEKVKQLIDNLKSEMDSN